MPDHPLAHVTQTARELASHLSERDPHMATLFRQYADAQEAATAAVANNATSHVGDLVLYFMAGNDPRIGQYWSPEERDELRTRIMAHLDASTQALDQIARLGRLPSRIATTLYQMIALVTLEIAVIGFAFWVGLQRPDVPPALASYAATPVVVAAQTLCPGQTLVFTPTGDVQAHADRPDVARQAHVVRTWKDVESGVLAVQLDGTPVPIIDYYTNAIPGLRGVRQSFDVPKVPPNTYRFDTTVSGAGMSDSGYRVDVTVPASCFTGVRP